MGVDVHTQQEIDGERAGSRALEHHRADASAALANRPGFDIANLDDQEFQQGLERIKVRQQRLQRILDTVLVENVHYGNPDIGGGRKAFKKPMLLQSGAEELRNFFRLTMRHVEPAQVIEREDYASVTVTIGMFDNTGRLICVRTGNCNTREKRFEKNNGQGFTYKDAREMVHNCLAMAEKRAGTLATREATGATGFFAAEEEMDKALAPEAVEFQPWTEEEKTAFYAAAKAKGMNKQQVETLVAATVGERHIGTGTDATKLMDAVARWEKPRGQTPVRDPQDGYDGGTRQPGEG